MQLDTETASAILKSSAQCNAVAEEAMGRIVELMQEQIALRDRIGDLERALEQIDCAASNGDLERVKRIVLDATT